jgi:alpha/beta superfamily hydrolase
MGRAAYAPRRWRQVPGGAKIAEMPLMLHTTDGHELGADLAEALAPRRGVAVVCHPHPLYGGDRFNGVVDALFRALPGAGFTTIRFDFRAAHDHGVAERLDAVAAIDAVADGSPVVLAGYSFGALVALSTRDERIAAVVAVAPPLTAAVEPPAVPTLVLSPRDDQFCPAEAAGAIVAQWPTAAGDVTVEAIESSDHFLAGRTGAVAERTVAWLGERFATIG